MNISATEQLKEPMVIYNMTNMQDGTETYTSKIPIEYGYPGFSQN